MKTRRPRNLPVPAAVYARAEALLGPNLERNVLNAFVVPHWLDGRDEFWYRRELIDGAEFVIVDASNGRKRTAFDHALVAQGLSAALGAPQDPKRLPFDNLSFSADGKLMTVGVAARTFACELGSGMCSEITATNEHKEWLKSPDGRAGVSYPCGQSMAVEHSVGRCPADNGRRGGGRGIRNLARWMVGEFRFSSAAGRRSAAARRAMVAGLPYAVGSLRGSTRGRRLSLY